MPLCSMPYNYAPMHYASTSIPYARLILQPPRHLVYSDNLSLLPLWLSKGMTTPMSCSLWNFDTYVTLTIQTLHCIVTLDPDNLSTMTYCPLQTSSKTCPPWHLVNSEFPATLHPWCLAFPVNQICCHIWVTNQLQPQILSTPHQPSSLEWIL